MESDHLDESAVDLLNEIHLRRILREFRCKAEKPSNQLRIFLCPVRTGGPQGGSADRVRGLGDLLATLRYGDKHPAFVLIIRGALDQPSDSVS